MNAVRQQGAFKTQWPGGKKAQKLEYSQNETQYIIDISLTRSQQSDSDRVHIHRAGIHGAIDPLVKATAPLQPAAIPISRFRPVSIHILRRQPRT